MTPDAKTFIDALHRLEADRDVDTIAKLFASGAAISNPLVAEGGQDGAKAFWTAYRAAFDEINSTFSTVVEGDGRVVLEWCRAGAAKGRPITYEGVSVLDVGDDGVTGFRTYFDSAKLGRQMASET